jgi:hypothetical protein
MAFEPLQTDEKIGKPKTKVWDSDTKMLFGCGGFVIASLMCYLMIVVPFFLFKELQTVTQLATACGVGLACAVVTTLLVGRRFGVPGICGWAGGGMCGGVFLYLHLMQPFVQARLDSKPTPEYPSSFAMIVPVAYVLVLLISIVFVYAKIDATPADS